MDSKAPERRRAIRYVFGGVAEVTDVESGTYLVSVATELGRFGCFVRTTDPFTAGATVSLRITHNGTLLVVPGKVGYVRASQGMGIAFGALTSDNQAVLEAWLAETTTETPQ